MSYEDYAEVTFDTMRNDASEAAGLYIAYYDRLSKNVGDRDEIEKVRMDLRSESRLFPLGVKIESLTEGRMDWVNSIIRSEARRAVRFGAEAYETKRREEARSEVAELENLGTFGMF